MGHTLYAENQFHIYTNIMISKLGWKMCKYSMALQSHCTIYIWHFKVTVHIYSTSKYSNCTLWHFKVTVHIYAWHLKVTVILLIYTSSFISNTFISYFLLLWHNLSDKSLKLTCKQTSHCHWAQHGNNSYRIHTALCNRVSEISINFRIGPQSCLHVCH